LAFTSTQAPSGVGMSAHRPVPVRRAAAAGYVPMSNDTKLEAKLHFFIL
jgi:hypothetical protein